MNEKINNKKNNEKLPFESEEEYIYRKKIALMMGNMSIISTNIEKALQIKPLNVTTEENLLISEFDKFKKIHVPERYKESNKYIHKGYTAFINGVNIVKTSTTKNELIKSYKYFDEWACCIKLSRIYIYKALEDVNFENEKDKKE